MVEGITYYRDQTPETSKNKMRFVQSSQHECFRGITVLKNMVLQLSNKIQLDTLLKRSDVAKQIGIA